MTNTSVLAGGWTRSRSRSSYRVTGTCSRTRFGGAPPPASHIGAIRMFPMETGRGRAERTRRFPLPAAH
eukprot:scaffold2406_cov363-Prasinococcus_capsulatus_cf.AAC.6